MMDTLSDEGAFLIPEVPPEILDLLLAKGWRHFGELFYCYKEVATKLRQQSWA